MSGSQTRPFELTPTRIEELRAAVKIASARFEEAHKVFAAEKLAHAKTYLPIIYSQLAKDGEVDRDRVYDALHTLGFTPDYELADAIIQAAVKSEIIYACNMTTSGSIGYLPTPRYEPVLKAA